MLDETNVSSSSSEEVYNLMNKDEVLIQFEIVSEHSLQFSNELKIYRKPFWIKNLTDFLLFRRAPLHRKHISELLDQCGCNTLKGYLDVTHALSLNDTMWVKKASEKDLEWKNVSLYRNEFDAVIAEKAFSGGRYEGQFPRLTPELGTNGQFAKCWIREDADIYLVKAGSTGARNAGLEPYSEYYGSELLSEICRNVVTYDLMDHREQMTTKSALFTSEEYGFVPMAYMDYGRTMPTLVACLTEIGFRSEFFDMMVGDTVIMNEDRHLGNFGVMVDNTTFEIVGFVPLFDHNISLLCYGDELDLKDPEKYLKECNKGHKLEYGSFLELGKKFLTEENKRQLGKLTDYRIKKHWKYNLEDWRLHVLNDQIVRQVKGLLE